MAEMGFEPRQFNSRSHSPLHNDTSMICPFLQHSVLVAQLSPTLRDLMSCSPPGSSVHGDSPGKNSGVGCHALLQGIFPTQGSNPGLLNCRWILYCLSQQRLLISLLKHQVVLSFPKVTQLASSITRITMTLHAKKKD